MNQRYSIFMVSFGLRVGLLSSCATKKDQILFQGLDESLQAEVSYTPRKIQVNDILDVKISALNPETAIPYNSSLQGQNMMQNASSWVCRVTWFRWTVLSAYLYWEILLREAKAWAS